MFIFVRMTICTLAFALIMACGHKTVDSDGTTSFETPPPLMEEAAVDTDATSQPAIEPPPATETYKAEQPHIVKKARKTKKHKAAAASKKKKRSSLVAAAQAESSGGPTPPANPPTATAEMSLTETAPVPAPAPEENLLQAPEAVPAEGGHDWVFWVIAGAALVVSILIFRLARSRRDHLVYR